jgi:hypothetical protein
LTSGHQDLGPRQRQVKAVPHRSRFNRSRAGRLAPPAVPLLLWRGQDGQVLGPGVQQGLDHRFLLLHIIKDLFTRRSDFALGLQVCNANNIFLYSKMDKLIAKLRSEFGLLNRP